MRRRRSSGGVRRRRTWGQRSVLVINAFLIVLALATAGLLQMSWDRAASVNRVQLGSSLTPADPDTPGQRVMNVLLVGSDSSASLDPDNPINDGRVGERNGDVVIVAHLDERDGSAALLSFPRDLWVEIAGVGREAKLNAAFAIGGPATLIETLELNFGLPIHAYVNVDFAGFAGLVDAVGAVEVYYPEPARDWNPTLGRSQTGFRVDTAGCHALDPETALAYVRSRYYQVMDGDGRWVTDPTSDLGRIRRQQDFLRRLMKRAIDLGARNPFVLRDLIDTGLEHVAIDQSLTPQLLLDLGLTYNSFEPDQLETYSFPATFGQVDAQSVLFPLEDEARPLLALFSGLPSDDPSTVRVRVVTDPDSPLVAAPIIAALEEQAFRVEVGTSTGLPASPTIRYGLDGDSARRLIDEALGGDALFDGVELVPELTTGLLGRDIVILVPSPPDDPVVAEEPLVDAEQPVDESEDDLEQPLSEEGDDSKSAPADSSDPERTRSGDDAGSQDSAPGADEEPVPTDVSAACG